MGNKNSLGRTALVAVLSVLVAAGPALANPGHDHRDDERRYQDDVDGRPGAAPDRAERNMDGPPPRENRKADRRRSESAPRYYEGWGGVPPERARRFAHEEGMRGYQPLPPGVRRNLMRGHALPPGLAMRRVPPPMLQRLPPPRPGYEWRVAGTDLVLVAVSTAIVADILVNVFQ